MPYEVNRLGRAVHIDFTECTADIVINQRSAIDEFLDSRSDIVARSDGADGTHLGMLLLWAVSAAEMYFRRVFAELSGICPVAQEKLSTHVAVIGALEYYGRPAAALAVLDSGSLSDPDSIRKRSLNILAIDINPRKSPLLEDALAEYDAVCQLRHALVHSFGRLGYGNVQILGLRGGTPCRLCLDLVSFQTCVAIVENLVRAYNQHAFATIIDRWIQNRIFAGEWIGHDKAELDRLYAICRCEYDGMPKSGYKLYRREIQAVVVRRNATR